jgi:putative inorganic carbon (hco3(-)) transporter
MVYYGLLLFFILEYIRPGSYVSAFNVLHLNSIVPLAVLASSLWSNRKVETLDVLHSPNARWIVFLVSLIIISGLTCDVKHYALNVFIAVIGYFFMYIVVRKEVYDLDRMKGIFKVLILAHVCVGLLTPDMFSGDGQRHYIASGSFLGDGNDFALSLNVTIPFCFFLMMESSAAFKKLFYAGILVLLVLAVVVTQSRGGLVALACVMFYLWLKNDRKILGVLGVVFIAVFIALTAPPELFHRMENLTGEKIDGSAQGRLLAWEAGVRMAADSPILGVGAGHFPVKYGVEYRPEGYGKHEIPWQTAHSSYFLILGELGIPGIIFLLGILLSNFIANRGALQTIKKQGNEAGITHKRLLIALNASLIAFAVGGAFLSAAYYPHIYLLAALLECGRNICTEFPLPSGITHRAEVPLAYRGVPV